MDIVQSSPPFNANVVAAFVFPILIKSPDVPLVAILTAFAKSVVTPPMSIVKELLAASRKSKVALLESKLPPSIRKLPSASRSDST